MFYISTSLLARCNSFLFSSITDDGFASLSSVWTRAGRSFKRIYYPSMRVSSNDCLKNVYLHFRNGHGYVMNGPKVGEMRNSGGHDNGAVPPSLD